MSSGNKDEEMICTLTADEHDALQQGLRALPDTMPPRAVWHRIREQAEAEGLIRRPVSRRPVFWYAGAGLAASLVLAALIVPRLFDANDTAGYATPTNADLTAMTESTGLQALMVESRRLENDLRSLPGEPRLVRAGTRATILEIEDRIAAIDYQLSDTKVRLTAEDQEIFWRERVRLMKSLVRLRYAQTQRTAY